MKLPINRPTADFVDVHQLSRLLKKSQDTFVRLPVPVKTLAQVDNRSTYWIELNCLILHCTSKIQAIFSPNIDCFWKIT